MIPGYGAKTPHASWTKEKTKKNLKKKNKGEIKTFSDKRKLRELIANRETLNEMIKFHIFR